MKKSVEKKRTEVYYEVEDLVYLKLRPYRQASIACRRNEKFAPKYFGPYAILERIGTVAYRLDLPPTSTIHPVIHVSQLKRARGHAVETQADPPILTDSFEWPAVPHDIIAYWANPETDDIDMLVSWQGHVA